MHHRRGSHGPISKTLETKSVNFTNSILISQWHCQNSPMTRIWHEIECIRLFQTIKQNGDLLIGSAHRKNPVTNRQ